MGMKPWCWIWNWRGAIAWAGVILKNCTLRILIIGMCSCQYIIPPPIPSLRWEFITRFWLRAIGWCPRVVLDCIFMSFPNPVFLCQGGDDMAIKIYKKHWLVLVAIALVALSVILLPQRLDEDKLQDLWEQGNYPAVAYGAEEILRRDNTAHEVREMAVQAYLATEQCLPALEHLLVLAEANWPISPGITREIVNSIDEMGEESVQELVVSLSQLLVHLGEPRAAELGIDLVTRPSLAELVPEFVEHLSVLRDNDPTGILFFRAWDNVLNNGSLEAMWRTAEIINEEIMFLGQSRVFQSDVLSQGVVQEQEWRSLQGQRPDEPLVALGLAGSMEGRDGLAWLLDWEEGKDVPPELADIYSHFKLDMLVQKDAIESSNLAWITPEDIGYLAYSSQGEMREELFNLAQELESSSQFQQHGEIIRLVQESEPNLVAEKDRKSVV